MQRFIVRRKRSRETPSIATTVLGLAIGTLSGFLLAELVAPKAERLLREPGSVPGGARTLAELVDDAQAALAADDILAELALEIRPVSRQTVEIHGWVPERQLRTRAYRVVREALGADQVVNCILVRGEDDNNTLTFDAIPA